MGRKPLQVLWVTFSMTVGVVLGRKLAAILLWTDDIKYKAWELTETEFWKTNGPPKHLEARVEFESVLNPGSVFRSYLPENGFVSIDEVLDKYDI